ncbi:PREDICTED: ABC transporter C family member 3 isoform X1 [Erythranthe guttata]|uniref:ABC transporter C family member 3 isoform X1 n=1 Tax=Erythranthe guttata TaxID=4155 RepID=UPI00064DFC1A|nr:PREDICTED: ABC transporter C family member 3 isoform X1 [Erythranthe guttata]|eukprot:XP_012848692.1 PREDICTED: ABC transporter C family member 3 isoform X1 [Erythranthe guttata]
MSVLFTQSRFFSFQNMGGEFFLNPIFLRFFTASLHLILLFIVFISWVFKKFTRGGGGGGGGGGYQKHNVRRRTGVVLCRKASAFSCLGLSLFNLALCLLNLFYWYRNGWSDEKILTLSDLGVKTLSWFTLYLFLQIHFLNSNEPKYPLVLRLWWGFFFSVSCYCVVVDFIYYKKHRYSSTLFWLSDIVSLVMGAIFCCIGFLVEKEDADTLLQEPLLNGTNDSPAKGEETVTPYANAGVLSLFTFSWMGPLISLGHKKTLNLEDVPQLAFSDTVRGAYPLLDDKLESYKGGSNKVTTLMLAKGLIFTTWREIALSAFYVLVYTFASYVGPYLIDTFVQYLNGHRDFNHEGYVLVSVFFVAKLFECLAQRHWFFKVQQAGYRARAALVAKIYNKGLTLSGQSRQGQTTGEIINFMSVDAERIGDFGWYIHDPWMVILQVALALAILYRDLGFAAIAAFAATILVMLANVPLGKLQERFQDKLMKSKDKRMKATSEVLRNMRILKLQAWELKFLSKILEFRNVETGWLRKYLYTSAITTFVFWGAPTFVSVVTFGACMIMGIPLESGKILSALATFRILQEPIYNLPDTISMIVQTKVSLDRIASFLSLDDLPPDVVEKLPASGSGAAVEAVDGIFSWDLVSPSPTLKNINFRVTRGMRVAICGTVGSGKSSLLSCILGEMPKVSGVIRLSGTKAYVAQTPWVQSGKIEENILFGKEMDRQRYNRVLEACSLNKDLEILSFGDQTVIGERGINLSGGQKQRIQIARALYQDADIYLFDDPFSAVDAHTGSHLFNECILGLLDSKTVIYVTHQVEFLPAADLILVMKDGEIKQAGKYNDILEAGSDFMELVGAHEEALSTLDSMNTASGEESSTSKSANSAVQKNESRDDGNEKADGNGERKEQLVQEEEREKGNVGLSVYWKYITTAYGGALVPFALLAQVLFQVLQIGSNYWMAWATPVSKDMPPPVKGSTLIFVYVALSVGSAFCIFGRALLVVSIGFKTANILFNKMHMCIFRAPMSFFDSTPSGRILSRASTDQSTVDLNMASIVGLFAFAIIQLLGIIAVMSQIAWQVFIIFIPVVAICIWLQRYYIAAARELARLCGVCKAPVIQLFSETLSGSSTIRSFDQESRFRDISMTLIDGYSRPKFHTSGAMEWLCIRLDVLSLVTFAFSLIFLISIPEGTIDPSVAGLAVTYGLNLNMLQSWVVWNLCTMENRIISVERLLQYTSIPNEPPLVVESNRPRSNWPILGEVRIQDLQVQYGPHMPFVLRGLTCTFFGGKRTGIVGRTGSGKSTLIQTLFRIVEPTIGQILIDGVNISSIGLHDLRSRLSIIPQDPTMFEGTVRTNLDPLEEHTDEQIWEVLDKCQLGDEVRRKAGKLDSAVSENGENWSVGQRQLVCLGRVLLKRSRVLVLDEATASVDTATDNLIQQTLKKHFTDSTVITIAHRITSVIDSDMVLVLDNGLVKEYDSPEKLLEDKSSSFSKLVAEYSMRSSSSFENLSNNARV